MKIKENLKWFLSYWVRKIYGRKYVFKRIYTRNEWSSTESKSGTGSEKANTRNVIETIEKILEKYNIKSMLDIPCGDMNWMKDVELRGIEYIGADIVEEIISKNKEKYGSKYLFKVLDIVKDKMPKVDLIFCRDCLVHLSNKDIKNAIKNMKYSGSKYLLTTSFDNVDYNRDIPNGSWRPINLKIYPFELTEPLEMHNEECEEGAGIYKDKSLILYDLSKL